jgi:hypothetical protein
MRALTMDELNFVSGGSDHHGGGGGSADMGWQDYRQYIPYPTPWWANNDPNVGYLEHNTNLATNPLSALARAIDRTLDSIKIGAYNRKVQQVNRDRNGDGQTTDAERMMNWSDMGYGEPPPPPVEQYILY